MAEKAHVASVEALESFRASLILFLSKARPTLEEVSDDALRTKLWLQNDQQTHWEKEVRRRGRELEQAQQELFSAKVSNLKEETAAQLMAVQHARRALREAEEKRDLLRKWNREFENRTSPLLRQIGQLHTFLTTDMSQAVAFLTQAVQAIEAYTRLSPSTESPGMNESTDCAKTDPSPAVCGEGEIPTPGGPEEMISRREPS
jgi:hypothetical protein